MSDSATRYTLDDLVRLDGKLAAVSHGQSGYRYYRVCSFVARGGIFRE
jgi:hypothetical protein